MSTDRRFSNVPKAEGLVNGRWLVLEVGYDESYLVFKTVDNAAGEKVLLKSHFKEQNSPKFLFDLGLNVGKLFFRKPSEKLTEVERHYWIDTYVFNGSKDFESFLRSYPEVAVYLVMREIAAADLTEMLYHVEIELGKNVVL